MVSNYVQSILPLSLLPIAWVALSADDHWQGSVLVASLFGLDTLRRLGTTTAEPARAIGTDKRKVRRLNGRSGRDVKSYKQVKASPKSRWSLLWLVNAVLTGFCCRHLFLAHSASIKNISYARTSALTETSASISFRLPQQPRPSLSYRPMVPGLEWTQAGPFTLDETRDWSAEVALDGLMPGIQYEYRLEGFDEPRNFTTFPDGRMSRHFRFVHAGSPTSKARSYRIPRRLDLWQWRGSRQRQLGWDALEEWVSDLRQRSAWVPASFALIGGTFGNDQSRQLFTRSSELFATLPVLPARASSPSSKIPEPAALTIPENQFAYGNAHFFRLHLPQVNRGEDDQDWRVDIELLRRELAKVNTTDWKDAEKQFLISPKPLVSSLSDESTLSWSASLCDLLTGMSNVVVLSETKDDFYVSTIAGSVIEITSPGLHDRKSRSLNPFSKVTTSSAQRGLVESDGFQSGVLKQFESGLSNWVSVEVENSTVYAVLVRDGQPIWRLKIVGERTASVAVGSVSQSFKNLLRSLGLLSTKWF